MPVPDTRAIAKLLIANRGEIAARIISSAHALGIATVAVYSDPDADAPYVTLADEAVRLPGAAPADTYLRGDLIVAAAGAEDAVVHVDRLPELRADATRERAASAEDACEAVRAAWRDAEELQLSMPLAVEALLVRLRRAFAGAAARAAV